MGKRKKQKSEHAWRTERQDPYVFHKMEYVAIGLTVWSVGCTVGYMLKGSWPWYLACVPPVVAAIVLDFVLPQYFTLIPAEKGESKPAWNLFWGVMGHGIIILLMPGRNWLREELWWLIALGCGAVVTAALGLCAEEFRRQKAGLAVAFFFAAVIGVSMVGHVNEVFDFSEPETYVLTVEDLEESRHRRRTSYECTVTMPDGTQMELDISRRYYNALEIGGEVQVEISTGALGIEYVNAYPAE